MAWIIFQYKWSVIVVTKKKSWRNILPCRAIKKWQKVLSSLAVCYTTHKLQNLSSQGWANKLTKLIFTRMSKQAKDVMNSHASFEIIDTNAHQHFLKWLCLLCMWLIWDWYKACYQFLRNCVLMWNSYSYSQKGGNIYDIW